MDAGIYDLEVLTNGAGGDLALSNAVVLTVDDLFLWDGGVYTIFAIGLVDGEPPLQVKVAVDSPVYTIRMPVVFN